VNRRQENIGAYLPRATGTVYTNGRYKHPVLVAQGKALG